MNSLNNNYVSYEQVDCCPVCGGKDLTIGQPRREVTQSIPMKAQEIYQQAVVKFTPALCNNCGLSFNVSGLSAQARDYIYTNYQFISPTSGMGVSNYLTYVNEVRKHLKSKDDKVLDIGGFDGFLVRQLSKEGYTNLSLIDPSAKIEDLDQDQDNINAVIGFFPQDNDVFKLRNNNEDVQLYDVVGAKDVVQMLPDLKEFFSGLNCVLKVDGIAVCCSVPLKSMHSLQYNHMGYNSYHYLATKYGFKLIDTYKKPENGYIVYVLKKVIDLKTASAHDIEAFINNNKLDSNTFEKNQAQAKLDIQLSDAFSPKVAQKVNEIFKENNNIVIYGTGFFTFAMLDSLDKQYFSLANEQDRAKLTLVNSSKDQDGYLYMLPDSSTMQVHYALEYLKDRHIDVLILGVLNPIFKDEILDNLKAINCTFNKLLYTPDLEQELA